VGWTKLSDFSVTFLAIEKGRNTAKPILRISIFREGRMLTASLPNKFGDYEIRNLSIMKLTPHQQGAFEKMKHFLSRQEDQVFVLRGYAGTGKTTLLGKVVDWLDEQDRPFRLLATTGRAAKVLQNKTGEEATTLHSCIYAFDEVSGQAAEGEQLTLNFNLRGNFDLDQELVFIIDEASMITHEVAKEGHTARFGSGSVLNDLVDFADGRQIIFVGDPCQLPPIAKNPLSSALDPGYLQHTAGLATTTTELIEIVRQDVGSEILGIAGKFREGARTETYVKYPKVSLPGGRNATLYPNHYKLQDDYVRRIRGHNYQEGIMLAFANWHVATLNKKIREALYPSWEIQPNELLMVVQNSYNVALANGDQVILEKAEFDSKRAGFTFLRVKVRALHNDEVYETLLIRELLYNQNAGLTREEVQKLIIDFDMRMRKKGLKRKSTAYKDAMRRDPYLNALRTKFGYAITCHKAQGGEWPHVYLNIHKSIYGMKSPQLYRWYYTALTRAQSHLHINDGWWVEGFDRRK
jgi:ATP-dependent exoDNAse (exonuclease V) alpha subunit